jgi:hypothetical protein
MERLMAAENSTVQQCQRLEGMALESMQNLEEDRVLIFVNALRKTLAAERDALNEIVITLKEDADERSSETLVSEKKGQKTSLANLWKATSIQFDVDSSGVMDAETLGLPRKASRPDSIADCRTQYENPSCSRPRHLFGECCNGVGQTWNRSETTP